MPELMMENGSGFRAQRISARGMGEMLVDAYDPCPSHVVDAHRRGRRHDAQASHRRRSRARRIKGGTLNGVRAIAGYVLDAKGRRSVVVLIINHANAGKHAGRADAC